MSAETLSAETSGVGLPDIHVWMTPEEAAETLSTSLSSVDQQLDQGDMESRVNDEGELQVLVCLPKREKPKAMVPATIERVDATPRASLGDTMLPLMEALRQTQGSDAARRAKRSARFAWATAAAILLAAGGTAALSVTAATRARAVADTATCKLDEAATRQTNDDDAKAALIADKATLAAAQASMSKTKGELAAKLDALTSERDRLKGQLAHANDALHKAEQDLVVERNVEDQLLTAALASHAAKAGQPKNQVVADGSN
ncbi:MAG TPA: hypothetical protein VGI81_27760 [Tepidisphaeraceae bacterium]|jgi:hypothetical protein